jgi:hypothetical protein
VVLLWLSVQQRLHTLATLSSRLVLVFATTKPGYEGAGLWFARQVTCRAIDQIVRSSGDEL